MHSCTLGWPPASPHVTTVTNCQHSTDTYWAQCQSCLCLCCVANSNSRNHQAIACVCLSQKNLFTIYILCLYLPASAGNSLASTPTPGSYRGSDKVSGTVNTLTDSWQEWHTRLKSNFPANREDDQKSLSTHTVSVGYIFFLHILSFVFLTPGFPVLIDACFLGLLGCFIVVFTFILLFTNKCLLVVLLNAVIGSLMSRTVSVCCSQQVSSLIAKAEGKLVSASCTDLVAIQSVWNILRVWPGDWQSVPGASVCVGWPHELFCFCFVSRRSVTFEHQQNHKHASGVWIVIHSLVNTLWLSH